MNKVKSFFSSLNEETIKELLYEIINIDNTGNYGNKELFLSTIENMMKESGLTGPKSMFYEIGKYNILKEYANRKVLHEINAILQYFSSFEQDRMSSSGNEILQQINKIKKEGNFTLDNKELMTKITLLGFDEDRVSSEGIKKMDELFSILEKCQVGVNF